MVDQLMCYSLALDVLRGEKSSKLVLADLLDEAGERGLAEWARSARNRSHKRLELALGVLPHRLGLLLACDFFLHAVGDLAEARPLIETLEQVRGWAVGARTDPAMKHTLEKLRPTDEAIFRHPMLDDLQSAARHAFAASQCDIQESPRRPRGLIAEARHACRRVARQARQLASSLRFSQRWPLATVRLATQQRLVQPVDELTWQIQHTDEVISHSLSLGAAGDQGDVHG